MKYEGVYLYAYNPVADGRFKILKYFEWYNKFRPHSSLGKKTPDEAYLEMLPVVKMAAEINAEIPLKNGKVLFN